MFNNWNGQYPVYNSQLTTNIIYVMSLDEALMKSDRSPSDMVFFNQDKNEFYRIKVAMDGRKTWATFPYIVPEQNTAPVERKDFDSLVTRIAALEERFKEVPKDESVG